LPDATPFVFPAVAPEVPVATQVSAIALPPAGVMLTESMQYAPPPAEQGKNAPLGSVTLAFAEVTPTRIAETESATVAKVATNDDLFISQNYRLAKR
jgi:hypothetical protein